MEKMKNFEEHVQGVINNFFILQNSSLANRIESAVIQCTRSLNANLPILICGNGGSASDAQHISGELVGKFLRERRALNVRSLTTDTSVITAWANDVNYETIFSRQVQAYGVKGGILLAISTSGNSMNVIEAAKQANDIGMTIIALTGESGGEISKYADILLNAPSDSTPRIQEMHMVIYHYICELIEINIK